MLEQGYLIAITIKYSYQPPLALVAQLDRALPSEGRGQRFESSRVRQSFQAFSCIQAILRKLIAPMLLQCSTDLSVIEGVQMSVHCADGICSLSLAQAQRQPILRESPCHRGLVTGANQFRRQCFGEECHRCFSIGGI